MNKKPLLLISFLLFIFSWVLPNSSFAQLDSTTATISVVENYYQAIDSLDERDMAVLTLTFDDISDVGYVNVVVYSNLTNQVVAMLAQSREELEASLFLFSDKIECPLFEIFPDESYRIEIAPMNQEGAYTIPCTISLN